MHLHQDNPLAMWVPYIDVYVDKLLRLEGRGDLISQSQCAGLGCEAVVEPPSFQGFRCPDCQDFHLFCERCIIVNHSALPFYRVQVMPSSFVNTTLKALGLCIQLGHPDTNICPLPQTAFHDEFIVINSDGIHEVSVKYCGCQQSLPKYTQLLRAHIRKNTFAPGHPRKN
ncbi:hypothetical protein BDZ97DRAFT_1668111 [Flammula alnicola]|nr:hypothetical protein BDZ97DRAFT_1668111 [Flammula alnicola]